MKKTRTWKRIESEDRRSAHLTPSSYDEIDMLEPLPDAEPAIMPVSVDNRADWGWEQTHVPSLRHTDRDDGGRRIRPLGKCSRRLC